MGMPEDIKTFEDVLALERLSGCMNYAIEGVIFALGDTDRILSVDSWHTFTQSAIQLGETKKEPWEKPELDQVTQPWIHVNYTSLNKEEAREERCVKTFPARYLFFEMAEIEKAWTRHLERCGVNTNDTGK